MIRNQIGTSFYYLLLFLTFRISRGFGIGSEQARFFRIKTFNILHITIITSFPIILTFFKVQEVNVNEACIC